jgi:hypothetical protein
LLAKWSNFFVPDSAKDPDNDTLLKDVTIVTVLSTKAIVFVEYFTKYHINKTA